MHWLFWFWVLPVIAFWIMIFIIYLIDGRPLKEQFYDLEVLPTVFILFFAHVPAVSCFIIILGMIALGASISDELDGKTFGDFLKKK